MYPNRGKGLQDTQSGVGMRGFSGRGSGQSRTLVLLDGQPLNDSYTGTLNWATLPVQEVERVEVVRGPFSSLYGGNAMGGVIHILTKPVDRRRMELHGEYGSQDTFRYGARLSDFWFGKLGVSLAYDRMQSGGYASQLVTASAAAGTGGIPVSGFIPALSTSGAQTFLLGQAGDNWWKQHSWRARADYAIASRTTVFVQYVRQQSGYGYDAYRSYLTTSDGRPFDSGVASISFLGQPRRITVSPLSFLPGDGRSVSNLISGKLHHGFSAQSRLRVGGGWNDTPSNYFTTPGTGSTLFGGPGLLSDRPARAWFGELQWIREFGSRHSFAMGTELRKDGSGIEEFNLANYTRRKDSPVLSYLASGQALNQGAYLQHQWRAAERLLVVSGVRYDYWRTFDGGNQTIGTAMGSTYATRDNHTASLKAAAVYTLPGGINVRGSVGNAFRNPTVFDLYRTWRAASGTLFVSNPDLRRESMIAWETGFARRWNGGLEAEAGYFFNSVRDLIYRVTDFNTDPRGLYRPVTNAALAHAKGVEASLRVPITSWLFMKSGYAWNDALIRRNPMLANTVGKRVPHVPAHTATGALFAARRRLSAVLSGRYVSRVFSTDTNTDVVKGVYGAYDPFFEMDASVRFQLTRHVSFQASADNLLNRRYYYFFAVPGRMVFAGIRIQK